MKKLICIISLFWVHIACSETPFSKKPIDSTAQVQGTLPDDRAENDTRNVVKNEVVIHKNRVNFWMHSKELNPFSNSFKKSLGGYLLGPDGVFYVSKSESFCKVAGREYEKNHGKAVLYVRSYDLVIPAQYRTIRIWEDGSAFCEIFSPVKAKCHHVRLLDQVLVCTLGMNITAWDLQTLVVINGITWDQLK